MTRGRSIDKTIQPSRALAQQRDYRARKAARIESLEAEVEQLRLENAALRDDLREARSGATTGDHQLNRSTEDIRQHLLRALERVDQLGGRSPTASTSSSALALTPHHPLVQSPSIVHYSPLPTTTYPAGQYGLHPLPSYPSTPAFPLEPLPHLHPPIPSPNSLPAHSSRASTYRDGAAALASAKTPYSGGLVQARPPAERDDTYRPTGGAYDENCCGGVFDCSQLATAGSGDMAEESTRALSHCRAEERYQAVNENRV